MTKRRHRRHSTAKKRELVEAYLNGEGLHALSKQHDVCRNLIRIWIEKYERGESTTMPWKPIWSRNTRPGWQRWSDWSVARRWKSSF